MANPLVRLGNWLGHLFHDESVAVLPGTEAIIKENFGKLGTADIVAAIADPQAALTHLVTVGQATITELAAQEIPVAGHVLLTALAGAFSDAVAAVRKELGIPEDAPPSTTAPAG